jgi:hypothetical protein
MLHVIAVISLSVGLVCALLILIDIVAVNRQPMMIMNFVYPISALYGGPIALLFYYLIGRKAALKNVKTGRAQMTMTKNLFWQSAAIGTLHCGSGCTLGDLLAESFIASVPVTLFGSRLVGNWTIDFVFALGFGIIFQYYAIKPMRKISSSAALLAAIKADTLSLTSWQVGMYGWMAIAFFLIFKHKIPASDPLFWFMMQVGMLLGFITAYPVNWWLIKKGIKETI